MGIKGTVIVAPVVHHDALLGQHDEIMSYALDREIVDQLSVRIEALARGRSNLDDDQRRVERHRVGAQLASALNRRIGFADCVLVDDDPYAISEHCARQFSPSYRVSKRSRDRKLHQIVPHALGCHHQDLAIDQLVAPLRLSFRPSEELRYLHALLGQGNRHRSTSPNTISSEPSTAETSASMWPLQRKSIACRCAKPGARILHL